MMTNKEKLALIDGFNCESLAIGTEEENIPEYVGGLLELLDVACREGFAIVFRPAEMSDGWRYMEAQEAGDGKA